MGLEWILYIAVLASFILSAVLMVLNIVWFTSVFEVFMGIGGTLIVGYIWAKIEKNYKYPILGRIYRRLPDTGKIYAMYLYEYVGLITAGLLSLLIVAAITCACLVGNKNPGVRDFVIPVVSLVICVFVEIPIVRYIFTRKVSMDYVACLALAVTTGVGVLMIYGGVITLQIGMLICGLLLAFFSASGFFRYLNEMLKIVSKEKMDEMDQKIGKVVEDSLFVAVDVIEGNIRSDTSEKILKVKVICSLVFSILGIIVDVAFFVFMMVFAFSWMTLLVDIVICGTAFVLLCKSIGENARILRDWNKIEEI